MKLKKRIASFLLAAIMIFATIPSGEVVFANEASTPNLGSYAGQLSVIIEDLTGWANDFEAYADMASLEEPIDMDLETFEGFLTRLYGYTSNLRAIHASMGTHDFDVLPFGDNWPGPRPPWPMVLMNVDMVLLGGLGYGYEYLQSYIAEPFISPTSEAVIYFIHEMNMGNPEESGFLGCVNCIRNLMFMLGHLGEMMAEPVAIQPEPVYEPALNTATVTAYALNLRSGPGVSHRAFNHLLRGDTITILSQRGNWFQVETHHGIGWVFGRYINIH